MRRKVKEGLDLSGQEMYDELAQLRLDVQQVPGEAFDPVVNEVPAAKLIGADERVEFRS